MKCIGLLGSLLTSFSATEVKKLLKIFSIFKCLNTISSPSNKLILEEPDVLFDRLIYLKVFHSWEDDCTASLKLQIACER